jgi:hypothetical protein
MLPHSARMRPLHYPRKSEKADASQPVLDRPALTMLTTDDWSYPASFSDEVSLILIAWLTRAVASR